MSSRHVIYGLLLLALALACYLLLRGPTTAPVTAELVVARDRAAEYGQLGVDGAPEAFRAIQPFADRPDAATEDLLRATNALLGHQKIAEARDYLERAEARGAEGPDEELVLYWCKFRLARSEGFPEEALSALDVILAQAPENFPAQVGRLMLLDQLDRTEEALALCEQLLEVPVEQAGSWRITVTYRYSRLLLTLGRTEEGMRYLAEYERLKEETPPPGEPEHQPGTLGSIPPHTQTAFQARKPASASFPFDAPFVLPEAQGQLGLRAFREGFGDVSEDLSTQLPLETWRWQPAPLGVLIFGEFGLERMDRQGNGSWGRSKLVRERVLDVLIFDRTNAGTVLPDEVQDEEEAEPSDGHTDLLVVLGTEAGVEVRLLENLAGRWQAERPLVFEASAYAEVGRLITVDYDYDGDLDLVAGVDGRVRVFRNDGFDHPEGAFTEVTDELNFPRGDLRPIAEDLDADNDVDLVFHDRATGAVLLWDNLRGGRFADVSDRLPDGLTGEHLVVADLDGDALPDLALFGETLRIHRRASSNGLRGWRDALEWPLEAAPTGMPLATDWDADGLTDLVWPVAGEAAAAGVLAAGFEGAGTAFTLGGAGPDGNGGAAMLALVDVDDDLDLDLLRLDAAGFTEYVRTDSPPALLLGLRGDKDNSLAVGALVEARRGLTYRRIYWTGGTALLGLGGPENLDVLRITWPNGVQQVLLDVPLGERYQVWQRRGLVGSCPFLYTWNGRTYEFISDVLGITPLGLPMAPGMFVPPDHDEFVLVHGDQLVPKDGFYEIQFTEELREVTYLDQVRLEVIDHPADVEVFQNERFSFPPFPEHHTHTVQGPAPALAVVDGEGRDWTAELAANDREVARPFEPLYGQFQGLAPLYSLELSFAAGRVRDAKKLRLLLNGWLVWTDASVNMAAARHPERAFVPPILQVPDGQGGWRDTGPPLGFPAGKLKTMVVDVTELVNREDPRLRLISTLEIYWDSIRLATDDDSAPLVTTSIEPASALLFERGFSAPITVENGRGMEWFEWDRTTPHARWNQHPGLYTKLGETLPLLTTIDDRYVIMGAGDALTVRFDASQAPPLKEGWQRDFLVFLDGWAKDRDPNTAEALYVEPLPFHGMSGYPYGADESFPDTDEHRAWRAEWNTRPGKQLISPLAVPRN